MATFRPEMASIGNYDAWSLGAGADKPAAVHYGGSHDDDTSYISVSTAVQNQTFVTDAASLPFTDMTGSYTTYFRARKTGANPSGVHTLQRYSSTDNIGGTTMFPTGSYGDHSEAEALDPTGGAWTDDSVKATELGVRSAAGTTDPTRVTTIYGEFSAEFVPGGFISLLAQLLPGVFGTLGAAITIGDFAALIQDPRFARKAVLESHEVRRYYEELRFYAHRRYALPEAA